MNIRQIRIRLMKLYLKLFRRKADPYLFTRILQEEGIQVGSHTVFFDPHTQTIDRERPWMLKIGDYCKITRGTTILCHDYSRSVLRRAYGEVIGEAAETVIGDNVFIGVNSVILMGAHIGSDVIIGAGSVVSGHIPDRCVAAGNPARVIRTLDEHVSRRREKTDEEAKLYFRTFCEAYGREPSSKEMNAFFPLYMERSREALEASGVRLNLSGDDREEIIEAFLQTEGKYQDYEAFCKAARQE